MQISLVLIETKAYPSSKYKNNKIDRRDKPMKNITKKEQIFKQENEWFDRIPALDTLS